MIQEYLFIDSTQQEKIEEYAPNNVKKTIQTLDDSDCWTVKFETEGENEQSAKLLSDVNSYMLKHFDTTVLINESSAYFNKSLFPHMNEFERKLRKLLYLKSALDKGDKSLENINDLETKDLGTIFELLFADEKFVKRAKEIVTKELSWKFTKDELLSIIGKEDENTLWDYLIGENSVPTLRARFGDLRSFRNDVMHAHNIDIKSFREAKRLLENINTELEDEINSITYKHNETDENYNKTLREAIANMNNEIFTTFKYEPINNIITSDTLKDVALNASYIPNLNVSGLNNTINAISTVLDKDSVDLSVHANSISPLLKIGQDNYTDKIKSLNLDSSVATDEMVRKATSISSILSSNIPTMENSKAVESFLNREEPFEVMTLNSSSNDDNSNSDKNIVILEDEKDKKK